MATSENPFLDAAAVPPPGRRRPRLPSGPAARVGLLLVALHVVLAVLAPLLAPHDPVRTDAGAALLGPSWQHWAGTDQYGRDVFSRVLTGGRYALAVSAAATVVVVLLGTVLGCLVALRGGWLDDVVMRLLDAVLAVPAVLAMLVVVTVLGASGPVVVLTAAVVYAPAVTRVVRAAALGVVPSDYVTAARMRGESTWSLLRREVLPNVVDVVAVEVAMRASWVVLLVSSLSFLGFGANPPTPDWGLMVSENRTAMTVAPLSVLAPVVALATLVLGLNLAADGLSKAWGVDRAREGAR